VKRVPELRDLSDDHHTALVLAQRCKQAARPDSKDSLPELWKKVLDVFSSHLEPHFQIEEDHLLPALCEIDESALADRIREDHTALRALREFEPVDQALVLRFGELLETHVRFEERQVFESTQQRLPAHALRAIAEACRSLPRMCPVSL
jgi:hypothetical protein